MCANCHVVTCEIEMKSLDALKAACKRNGWTFKEGQKKYKWYHAGWQDDSPVPRLLFTDEAEYQRTLAMSREARIKRMNALLGRCSHAIEVPGCNYEVGIIERNGQLIPIWDWFESALNDAMGKNGCALTKAYAVETSILEAQAHAYTYTEKALQDGTIQLTVQIPDF